MASAPTTVLRKPTVIERVGLSSATIYRLERAGKFPRSIPLGVHSIGWLEADIEAWIRARAENNRHGDDDVEEDAAPRARDGRLVKRLA